jgi:hypothetical protein
MTTKHKTPHAEPESTAAPSTAAAAATAPPATPTATATATPSPTPATATTPLVTAGAAGNNRGTKVDLQATFQTVIAGLLEYYGPTDVFHMAQGTFTRDELIAKFQSFVTACQTTSTANQSWRSAVQAERALQAMIHDLRKGVRGIVQARFGAAGAQNLQFGFSLVKPRKLSSESKAIAVEKGKATRKERNTLGKNQKKAIKGNVSVSLVVSPGATAQSAVATSTAPTPTPTPTPATVATVAPAQTGTPGAGGPPTAGH